MRVCAGPARNRRSGPHLPGEDGSAAGSMAPPRGSSAQWSRVERSQFVLGGYTDPDVHDRVKKDDRQVYI